MNQHEEKIRDSLRANNREFRQLESLHQHYEQELESLIKGPGLTQDQEIKRIELKKLKLQAKDRMAQIMRNYCDQI